MWAAFAPLSWGPLAFVAAAPFFWAIRSVEKGGSALRLGFVFGAVWFGMMLWWVMILGAVAWIPLTLLMALMTAAYGLFVWIASRWLNWRWYLVTVGGWAAFELIRSRVPFGGFPWGTLGYAAADTAGPMGAAQWIGATGWSVLAIATAAGLALFVEDRAEWRYVVDPAVVALLIAIAGGLAAPSADGEVVRVAIIQGNSPCPRIHCQNENQRIYEAHLALTNTLRPGTVDLVVWPENATGTPFEPENNEEVRQAIADEAIRLGSFMLISGTRTIDADHFENVNVLFDPQGNRRGEYLKQHPVPFGEYVPLRGLLGFIPQLDQVPRDMVRGEDVIVFPMTAGELGSVISFEGAFSRALRAPVLEGAELLVVTTNESSFGEGAASDQFIGMTRVNAAQFGMDLVHAAITGKSAIVLADGSLIGETELFTSEVLRGSVQFRNAGDTLYTRYGDWLQYFAIIGAAMALAVPGEDRATPKGALADR